MAETSDLSAGQAGGRGRARAAAAAAGLGAAILAAYLFTATRATLWDRDEPWYSRAAVEMARSGQYLYPTFNGQPFLEKPILTYWLMTGAIRCFGAGELAVRFFGVVGSVAACLLTWAIARRLLGGAGGGWAAAVLAASPMMLLVGTSATTDAVMMPFVVLAMLAVAGAMTGRPGVAHLVAFALAAAGAMYAKGPMGLVPLAVVVGVWLLGRPGTPLRWPHVLAAAAATAAAAGLFALWAVPANSATSGAYFDVLFGQHTLGRATSAMDGHGGRWGIWLLTLPIYVPITIVGFFPWVLFLPGAISAVAGGRVGGAAGRALLGGWVLVVFVGFSLVATKLHHYVLPYWPALAVAVAGVIVAAERGRLTDRDRRWLRRGQWLFAPMAFGTALACMVGPWFAPVEELPAEFRLPLLVFGVPFLLSGAAALRYHRAGRYRASAAAALAGMAAIHAVLLLCLVPAVERIKLTPPIAEAIRQRTAPDVPVFRHGFHEPSLSFYVGRTITELDGLEDVAAWAGLEVPGLVRGSAGPPAAGRADAEGPGVLVISRKHLTRVEERFGPLGLEVLASRRGLNYTNWRWMELLALGRGLSPPAAAPDSAPAATRTSGTP